MNPDSITLALTALCTVTGIIVGIVRDEKSIRLFEKSATLAVTHIVIALLCKENQQTVPAIFNFSVGVFWMSWGSVHLLKSLSEKAVK